MWPCCCHCRGYAMDIVAFGCHFAVSDGHGALVVAFAGMRWMGLFLLPLSRVCDGHGCSDCHFAGQRWIDKLVVTFAGMRWMWLFWIAISRVRDGHGTCRTLAAGFACVAICSKNFHVLQLFDLCICLVLAMAMNGQLVEILHGFGKDAGRNVAFCERAQKLLE